MITFGPYLFDLEDRTLYEEGVEIPLPPRARETLACLVAAPGKMVSKEALIDAVWRDAFVSDTALKEAVFLIRRALNDDSQKPTYIQTVHRRGYRFVAPVGEDGSANAVAAGGSRGAPPRVSALAAKRRAAFVLALVSTWVAVAAAVVMSRNSSRSAAPASLVRSALEVPDSHTLWPAGLAISADGRQVIYVGKDDVRRLYLRRLGEDRPAVIEGTEGARRPFLSPDGRWVGFFSTGRLKSVPVEGGSPRDLAPAPLALGGAWSSDGTIFFAAGATEGIYRVSAAGGDPQVVTRPDRAAGEIGHRWPELVPGANALLYTVWRRSFDDARIARLDLESGDSAVLVLGGSHPRLVAPDLLLFARSDQVMAVALGPSGKAEPTRAVPVLGGLDASESQGAIELAVSASGDAVYTPGTLVSGERILEWWDLDGRSEAVPVAPGRYQEVALAPDGRRAALTTAGDRGSGVWIADLDDGELLRPTYGEECGFPIWTPDGRQVIFSVADGERAMKLVASPAGGGKVEELLAPGTLCLARAVTSAGRLIYTELDPATGGWSLKTIQLGAPPEPRLLYDPPQSAGDSALSPSGRWLAFESTTAGKREVYVRQLDAVAGGQWQISIGGGREPHWSADGRRLFYRSQERLLAVGVESGDSFRAFDREEVLDLSGALRYELAPAGDRVLVLRTVPGTDERRHLRLILGWGADLYRQVSRGSA